MLFHVKLQGAYECDAGSHGLLLLWRNTRGVEFKRNLNLIEENANYLH